MYILSDLNGNLIQRSNVEVKDFQKLIDRFSNELGVEVIGTDNELLYSKTEETGYFDIIIENNEIVDIIPKELPISEIEPICQKPTLEERVMIAEDIINFLLGL